MAVRSALILQLTSLTLTIHLLTVSGEFFKPFNVSYDHRALIIDGKRRMLISAGVHYPRATPEVIWRLFYFYCSTTVFLVDEMMCERINQFGLELRKVNFLCV